MPSMKVWIQAFVFALNHNLCGRLFHINNFTVSAQMFIEMALALPFFLRKFTQRNIGDKQAQDDKYFYYRSEQESSYISCH